MEYYKAIKYYVVKGYFKPWGMFQIEMKRPYAGTIVTFILQTRKWRLREVKYLAQSHRAVQNCD